MPRVMISYRNVPDQKKFAHELGDAFEAAGVDTWLDTKDIKPPASWEDQIVDGIKNSDYVVVCLSEEYYDSDVCMMECYIARGYRKKILPVCVSQDPNFNIWGAIPYYEETKGLEDVSIAHIYEQHFFGLALTEHERIQRVIDAIVKPISEDATYDIYISYKSSEATFATQIADDLNKANLSTFVATRNINIGDNWREAGWSALLQAKYHIVILTPDIKDSIYIKNEIRVSRTKDTVFIPILVENLTNNIQAQNDLRSSFTTKEFALLNDIQWLKLDKGYDHMIQWLIAFLKQDMS